MSCCDICDELAAIRTTLAEHGEKLTLLLQKCGTQTPPPPPAGFAVDAAAFDGTNDWLSRGGNLTGISDSAQGTVSVWLNATTLNTVLANDNIALFLGDPGIGNIDVILQDGLGGGVELTPETTFPSGAWAHLISSWDLATESAHVYINDTLSLATPGFGATSVDYDAATDFLIGNSVDFGKYAGDMAELWFDTTYIDLSVEANRRKFISAAGKPVDLGATGATPTGSQPLIYLHLDDGEAAANFALNAGSGGNFTVNGTLATAATSPSD